MSECYDLKYGVFSKFAPDGYDLIIDATASRTVSHVIETELNSVRDAPPIVGLSVSARAEHGSAIVRQPSFPGGPIDLARRAKLKSLATPETKVFASAFWPKREDISLFQPEPGCSDPTFVGSAIDMAYHSSALMTLVIERLKTLKENQASVDFVSKPTVSQASVTAHSSFLFCDVSLSIEKRFGYHVLITDSAKEQLITQIKKSARELAPGIETGGLMFGEIDDSTRSVWLDAVTGPPPDSEASEEKFLCGIEGTHELAAVQKERSDGSSSFIGIWHTHPVSQPEPSKDDLNAMAELLLNQEQPPRHVIMLIIGHAATSPEHVYYLYRRNEFMRVVMSYKGQLKQDDG